jgi:hypothetical protein
MTTPWSSRNGIRRSVLGSYCRPTLASLAQGVVAAVKVFSIIMLFFQLLTAAGSIAVHRLETLFFGSSSFLIVSAMLVVHCVCVITHLWRSWWSMRSCHWQLFRSIFLFSASITLAAWSDKRCPPLHDSWAGSQGLYMGRLHHLTAVGQTLILNVSPSDWLSKNDEPVLCQILFIKLASKWTFV